MKELTESLGFLLHGAAKALRREFEARAREHGLSNAQWRMLVYLVLEDGAPQARMAEVLEVEPISVSRLVDRMEAFGWAERRADPTDRRVRLIYPTERGRTVFNEVRAVAGEVYDKALAGLNQDERAAFKQGLKTIVANLASSADESEAAKASQLVRR